MLKTYLSVHGSLLPLLVTVALVAFFVLTLAYAWSLRRARGERMARLPLDDGEEAPRG